MTASDERRYRATASRSGASLAGGAVYAVRRPRLAAPRSVVLVYSTALLDESGRLVQNEVIPLEIEFSSPGTWVRALSRPVLRRLMFEPQLRRALAAEIAQRVARAELVTIGVATAVERRLSACLAAIDRQSLELVWQGSLFDRRADCQARMTHESLADVRAHLARRRASALALTTVHESEPRLVAAWLKN